MSAIGDYRAVEGGGGGSCLMDSRDRNPTNRRQGKRPASGAAYVVGKIEVFTVFIDTPCWPVPHFPQPIQWFKRRRSDSGRHSTP